MIYQWRTNHYTGIDANAAGSFLNNIRETHGCITPDVVVEVSKPVDAVLHKAFTWDDTVAAIEFRKSQARSLIRNLVYTPITESKVEVRAFTVVRPVEGESKVYLPTNEAMELYGSQIVENARKELISYTEKYKNLKELSSLLAAIDLFVNDEEKFNSVWSVVNSIKNSSGSFSEYQPVL